MFAYHATNKISRARVLLNGGESTESIIFYCFPWVKCQLYQLER